MVCEPHNVGELLMGLEMPKILSKNFSNLYSGDNHFVIPPYQRSITWPKDQWNYLYSDIISLVDRKNLNDHLFQIFQFRQQVAEEGTKHEVGDGQQRLVQSSLFLAGLAYALESISRDSMVAEHESRDIDDLIMQIMGSLKNSYNKNSRIVDSFLAMKSKGKISPRIRLKKEAQVFYEKILNWEAGLESDSTLGTTKGSEESILLSAFQFYGENLHKYLAPKSFDEIIRSSQSIIDAVTEKIVFAVAYFDTSETMQSSFEATNSRGIALTESELIKNHIFKNFTIEDQEKRADEWKPLDQEYWVDTQKISQAIASGKISERTDRLDKLLMIHTRAISKGQVCSMTSNHPIFQFFKDYHDAATDGMNLEEVRKYYAKIIHEIVELSSIYQFVLDSKYEMKDYRGKNCRTRNNAYITFYHRLVSGAGVDPEDFNTIVFMLEMKIREMTGWGNPSVNELSEDSIHDYIRIIESYIIRKALMGETTSDAVKKIIECLGKYPNLTPAKMYDYLLMLKGRKTSFEGTEDILLRHSSPVPIKESLGKNLNFDYDCLITSDEENPEVVYSNKQTLEHFMPQKSNNYQEDWPLPESQIHLRANLIGCFGNFVQIGGKLNSSLGNNSYKSKMETLRKDYKGKNATIQTVLDSAKWDFEEISAHGREKLEILLKYYRGPERTVKGYPLSVPVALNKLKVGDRLFFKMKTGELMDLHVGEEGRIVYENNVFESERSVKQAIAPGSRGNQVSILVQTEQANININKFIAQLESEIGN